MKWTITSHCTDDGRGEYTIRLHNEDLSVVLFGMDALQKLWSMYEKPATISDATFEEWGF